MKCPLLIAVVLLLSVRAAEAAERLSFNRDIRPILSDACFQCHGPDEKQRKAGLRLDVRDIALKPAESGAVAIVPGQPNHSEIIKRVLSTDDSLRMPPANSGKKITPAQIELLKRWIADGAEYQGHWAFIPPVRPAVPVRPLADGRKPMADGRDPFPAVTIVVKKDIGFRPAAHGFWPATDIRRFSSRQTENR